jgi:hypothetical protein
MLMGLKRLLSLLRPVLLALLFAGSGAALAQGLPPPAELKKRMATAPVTVTVVEPHLSTKDKAVRVDYLGYPAQRVLDTLLGSAWKAEGMDVEFRALDGYVSRIPAERFTRYSAYFVFERKGQRQFQIDNLLQNEKRVALGPYYLVWDNIRAPDLIAEGGSYWPYQISQVLVSASRLNALLPGAMRERFAEHAALAQKLCLSCHQVNGHGGNKWPINLAVSVKGIDEATFLRWVLEPGRAKPGTSMPGLPEAMPQAQRQDTARKLYDYLKALPAAP